MRACVHVCMYVNMCVLLSYRVGTISLRNSYWDQGKVPIVTFGRFER